MSTTAQQQTSPRTGAPRRITPTSTGAPDPRPVTGFTTKVTTIAGKTRIEITLDQPCIIRAPLWAVVSVNDGTTRAATSSGITDATHFYIDYGVLLAPEYCFIEVPYQDTQVQNFQGGFVAPGARWFRSPS